MTKTPKVRTFQLMFDIKEFNVSLSVPAKDFEEALEKARAFKVLDLVDVKGDWNDGKLIVSGIFDEGER